MILQYLYKPVLNFIYEKITYRISNKARNIVLFLLFLLILFMQFITQIELRYGDALRGLGDIVVCFAFCFIILISVNKKMELLKWRKVIYVPYVITWTLLFIAVLDHDLGETFSVFPVFMMTCFMCLFFVWGNREDYETLFVLLAKACIVFLSVIFIICIVRFPYYDSSLVEYSADYAPFGLNPNAISIKYLPGVFCSLFLIVSKWQNKSRYLYAATAGMSFLVIVLTGSRNGLLCSILIILVFVVYSVYSFEKKDIIKKIIATAIMVFISFCLSFSLITLNSETSKEDIEEKYSKVIAGEVKIAMGEEDRYREVLTWEARQKFADNELLCKIDSITAGRIAIWSVYFDNISLRGTGEELYKSPGYAHNHYIEMAYKGGIFTGIAYFVLNLLLGIVIIIELIKNRNNTRNKWILFSIFAFIAYFIISMFHNGLVPFRQALILIYFIAMSPLFKLEDRNAN